MVVPWQRGKRGRMPDEIRRKILMRLHDGEKWLEVQKRFKCSHQMLWIIVREAGGVPPRWPTRSKTQLSLKDREEISRGLVGKWSFAEISRRIGRDRSTVYREVERNGGQVEYRAVAADLATLERAKRPKLTVFESNPVLAVVVEGWLEQNWSPEQISGRLVEEFPDDETMRAVPETIYQALFVQGRTGLNKELVKHLRSQRKRRKSRAVTARNATGDRIQNMVMIADRPAEIEDRAVPGHWEGDLIIGAGGKSQTGTLVERSSGFTMLIELPDDRRADTVAGALQRQIGTLPAKACRSITWDQGIEMAAHAKFTIATDIPVFFCDPHAPWQRGSNENTNGLLRQYFPKGCDLSEYSQPEFDDVAAELNNRPRKRLGYLTPLEVFNKLMLH